MVLVAGFPLRRLVMASVGISWVLPLLLVALLVYNVYGSYPTSMVRAFVLLFGGLVVPLILVLFLNSYTRRAVRRGLMDGRWSQAEQNEAHVWLKAKPLSRATNVLLFGTFALAAGSLCFVIFRFHRHVLPWGGLYYFGIAPAMARNELLRLLAPPRTQLLTLPIRDLHPLQSSHWGQH